MKDSIIPENSMGEICRVLAYEAGKMEACVTVESYRRKFCFITEKSISEECLANENRFIKGNRFEEMQVFFPL